MPVRNLDALFAPRSIALIGASERPGSVAAALTRNLLAGRGKLVPQLVNPRHDQICGQPCRGRVTELDGPVDLAVVAVPVRARRGVLRDLARAGTRVCLLVDRDDGAQSIRLRAPSPDDRLLATAAEGVMRIIGPGATGLMLPDAGINLSVYPRLAATGRTALVTTAWSVAAGALAWAAHRGIGFSSVLALGDTTDVDEGDLLDHLGADPATDAIVLHIDYVRDTRKFMSAARATARTKPVITLRAGRTLDEDGLTDAVYAAAIRRAGMLRVAGLDALYLALDSLRRPLEGRRLQLLPLCNSAQVAGLLLDGIRFEGESLAVVAREVATRLRAMDGVHLLGEAHAVVCHGAEEPADFASCLSVLLEQPDLAILMVYVPDRHGTGSDTARAVIARLRDDPASRRRVTACWLDADADVLAAMAAIGMVHTDMPGNAIVGHRLCEEYQRNQVSLMETPPARRAGSRVNYGALNARLAAAGRRDRIVFDGQAALTLLSDAGIPVAGPVDTLEMAGLQVGVEDRHDFGPVIRVRLEGFRMADQAVGLLPLNVKLAAELVDLACSGDAPPGWKASAAEVLVSVAELVIAVPVIEHLEARFLPLSGGGLGATAARLDVNGYRAGQERFLAIRPYPADLVQAITGADGHRYLVRPIRPEDEPGLRAAFDRLSDEEVRMRFMYRLNALSHSHAARLTQIDYDREMALVLTDPGSDDPEAILGVVRLMADPDLEDAEFAIIVAGHLTRRGLGRMLLERLIAYARQRGIHRLCGDVLPENRAMLALATRVGLRREPHPEESRLVRLVMELA